MLQNAQEYSDNRQQSIACDIAFRRKVLFHSGCIQNEILWICSNSNCNCTQLLVQRTKYKIDVEKVATTFSWVIWYQSIAKCQLLYDCIYWITWYAICILFILACKCNSSVVCNSASAAFHPIKFGAKSMLSWIWLVLHTSYSGFSNLIGSHSLSIWVQRWHLCEICSAFYDLSGFWCVFTYHEGENCAYRTYQLK